MRNPSAMLWEIEIAPAAGRPDRAAERLAAAASALGLFKQAPLAARRGYLLEGDLDEHALAEATRILVDPVVEQSLARPVGDGDLAAPPAGLSRLVYVLYQPGVMDPAANTAERTLREAGVPVEAVRTYRKYWFGDLGDATLNLLAGKLLANDAIEQVVRGPLALDHLALGAPRTFELIRVPLREMTDEQLVDASRRGQLALSLAEMQTIQQHYAAAGRDPTDVELETIAQTWSEHCSHKTLAGPIHYVGPEGELHFDNMLRETIFAATEELRCRWGEDDWCVSVFRDNAGIVDFCIDSAGVRQCLAFKVETHNHPSAIEPYGGANTGLGGVLRDILGVGLGAAPIASTDVFCFAPPQVEQAELPPGALHPRRTISGVVSGVRDYGNRMGVPTVSGAVYFDPRYLGNPLVYCGSVGLLPEWAAEKQVHDGDLIVALGGRTGRDGIHGATFSSIELTSESETISGGAVQIGDAVTEKMVHDVLLAARDARLFHAVTDCGAGGFSSAVGEMGEPIGAVVQLDSAPLKYRGLSYTEIWISESQERMVLAVAPDQWPALEQLCGDESVEATVLGRFEPTGRLRLEYEGQEVGDLSMQFLHDGRPHVVREARYEASPVAPLSPSPAAGEDYADVLRRILSAGNVASKEGIVRQYDHEVQAATVLKPLVGPACDGPGDACVLQPVPESPRGAVVACGMNPLYGELDVYAMAASAIDEAVRNCVAVGADPRRIALLDNFCWGDVSRPETLGSLVRAAIACRDLALAYEAPFISGKDSLNNEFRYQDAAGASQVIAIPPSLLISALGQIPDVAHCVTSDFKAAGNAVYVLGVTRDELGGSHYAAVTGRSGGAAPGLDAAVAKQLYLALHGAIAAGCVAACHDASEGGLAVALAEMAFGGDVAAEINLAAAPQELAGDDAHRAAALLFAESNARLVCEVAPEHVDEFERRLAESPCARVGSTVVGNKLVIRRGDQTLVDAELADLKAVWKNALADLF